MLRGKFGANMIFFKKRIFITGIDGLVGSHLTEELIRQGAIISGLIHIPNDQSIFYQRNLSKNVTIYPGDLRSFQQVNLAIKDSKPEIIFHLGAQTIVRDALLDPIWTLETNVQGTWNVLESARKQDTPLESILVASSDKAYGASTTLPYLENFPIQGEGPYDVSKSCTDLISQSFGKVFGMPIFIARCGNIYGPGDTNWSRIVPGTFKSLFSSEIPTLRSDGSFTRDYIFVGDVVNAYLTLAKNSKRMSPGSAYNFSHDSASSVFEIYASICEAATGKYVEPVILNVASHEIHDQHLSSLKAKSDFGWEAFISLAEGLSLTASWYQNMFQKKS